MKKLFTFFVAAIICSGISTNATTLAPIPYTQNFENGGAWPTGWSTDNPNVWSLSTTWNGANNPGGYNVYSDYNPLETGTVFSPGFDGSVNLNIHVKFYHYWRADYSGNTQDGYLWGSRDGGLTYPYLLDEWHHNNPAIEEGEKIYDISSWADGYDDITFKWVVLHNNDWYWQFDNFEIYEVATPGLWTGTVSTSWNTAGNWDDLTVPNSTVSVTIPSGTPHSPYIGYGVVASCNNLTINSGATLTQSGSVISNSHLNVYGDLNSDYGTFTQSGYAYLYFRGNTSAYWDDDNMDDTYRNVRIIKTNSTDEVSLWQHMTIERNLEIVEGTFLFSNNWTLTINSTGSNALEVESGGILQLANSQTIDVAGDVQFLNGSQAIVTGGLIRCSGDFRVEANTSYDIQFAGGTVEMYGSSMQYIEEYDGNTELYNLIINKSLGVCSLNYGDLDIRNDLTISDGTLYTNDYDIYIGGDWTNNVGTGGFTEGTGRVVFNGPGPGMQYIHTSETFYILENASTNAIRIDNSAITVTCNVYDWTSGSISVAGGTFIAYDLAQSGIFGNYYALTNSEIHLHQDANQYLDLFGNILIYGNGFIKVYGGKDESYWCNSTPLNIHIDSGGVLDFVDIGIKIFATYPLTYDLEGGTIRTGGNFTCQRTDFYPTGSTFEFYGGTDANISVASGSILYDVIINKSGGDKSALKKMARNGNIVESTKSNTVVLSSNIYLEYELIILEGELTLNGNELLVHDGCSIYGTLNMTDPADVLSISWSGDLTFYSGSTGNISNGKIYLHKWIVTNSGCSFVASTNNTIYFVGDLLSGNGGMANYEPSAVYGNIILTKIVHETQLGASATESHIVNGNFVINEGSTLVMQDKTLIVHGIFTDHASSKVYVHNTTKDGENSTSSDKGISAVSSEYKGGYLEIDNDFTLTGLLDVGDGDVLLHSDFGIAPTGVLTINGGSFIADQPNVKSADPNVKGVELQDTKDWQYLQGTINLTSGLFEISHNSFYLSSTATTNITGGIIRAGGTFLAYLANNFQPTAGTVELIGEGVLSQYIALGESNYFHDLVIDRTNLIDIYNTGYDLHINNDFTILGGGLDTKFWDIYIGGDWTNNVGASAFVENTNTVTFTGTNDVNITTGETFYNLTLDKSSSGDWLTLSGNVTAYGDLIVNGGALHTGANILDVYGNVNINSPANLFVQAGGILKVGDNKDLVADLGSSFYIEGSPSNYATLTHSGTGRYGCSIFGEIAANYAVFEYMGQSGINIKEGATVNSIYTFNNCIFQKGAPAPSALLTLNNDQVFTCNNAYFENTFGNTQYNVWKHFDTGQVTFVDATGFFAGPAYEYDPNERIDWPGFTPGLWTGAVSSDWFTPENWDDYIIPDATTDVTIPAGTPNDPVINGAAAYCHNITVDAGTSLEVGNNYLYVSHNAYIYGELVMTNPSGVMHIDYIIYWEPGSTDNVTAGEIRSNYWTWKDGTNAQLGTGNTAYIKSGISPYDADASYGNLVVTTSLSDNGGVDDKGLYPVRVTGNCLMESGINWQTPADWIINGTWEIENGAAFRIYSGALVSCDQEFTLDGELELDPDASTLIHGMFYFGASGILDIDAASFICDYTLSSGWMNLYGDITLTTGTLEFTDANVSFAGTSTISDGIVRAGRSIRASAAGAFQPSGGTLELTGSGFGHYIQITNGNYVYNMNVNRSDVIQPYSNSSLTILNDLTVNSTLNSNSNTITVNGNIDINSGGSLNVNSNSTLEIGTSQVLNVNSGGTLSVVGSSGNEATITHSSGYYNLNVMNGGTISAEYGIFEYMASAGINLMENAIVDAGHPFDNCLFSNGTAGGRLLTVNSIQSLTVNNAIFPTNTWGGAYNVYKSVDAGIVNFNSATGGFQGEAYDYDPYNRIHWTVPSFNLDLTVFLEGPFNPGTFKMDTDINGILPNNHPFNPTLPYFNNPMPDWYYTGGENTPTPNIFVVDWVLVELRDATSAAAAVPGTMIAQQAAFVLNTGEVVDLDGLNMLNFTATINDGLYVVVWHRNHLGVISANALVGSGGVYTYNFSTGSGQAYGGASAQKNIGGSGTWGMMSGDGNGSGHVLTADKNAPWAIQAGTAGYLEGDYNLNGQVNNPDKDDYWVPNLGSDSYIPE